jgi:hypothetical protein
VKKASRTDEPQGATQANGLQEAAEAKQIREALAATKAALILMAIASQTDESQEAARVYRLQEAAEAKQIGEAVAATKAALTLMAMSQDTRESDVAKSIQAARQFVTRSDEYRDSGVAPPTQVRQRLSWMRRSCRWTPEFRSPEVDPEKNTAPGQNTRRNPVTTQVNIGVIRPARMAFTGRMRRGSPGVGRLGRVCCLSGRPANPTREREKRPQMQRRTENGIDGQG